MIKIFLLGTFQVIHEGKEVTEKEWHTRQARQLLKLLITERPRPVARERLIEIFWSSSSPKAAATTLRSAINALRNVLEPERASRVPSKYIHTQAPGYAFREHPEIWLDVLQFEKDLSEASSQSEDLQAQRTLFSQAIDLYRDDYLLDDPYADWAQDERERLRERYFDALLQMAAIEAQQGDYAHAIALCRRILARENIREKAFQSLMQYQAESGDSAGALLTYERCRTVLLEALGADPSPTTQALHQQILEGKIGAAISINPQSTSDQTEPKQTQSPTDTPKEIGLPQLVQLPALDAERLDIFVGRGDETENFSTKINQALDGKGSLLAIIGEAGIGKTRFAYNLLQMAAEREATILSAACHALEQQLPFAPIIDILGRCFQEMPLESITQLSHTGLSQISRILPTLRDRLPELPAPPSPDGLDRDENRRQLIDGIVTIFIGLARLRPLLIFVDDLHWADSETIFVLSRLSHKFDTLPLCIIVAYREGDATDNSPLITLQHAEHRLHPTHFLKLSRLRLEHIQNFVQQYFLQKFRGRKKKKSEQETTSKRGMALAKLLYNTTRGNALFVTESIKALDEFDEAELDKAELNKERSDTQADTEESAASAPSALKQGDDGDDETNLFEAEFGHLLSLRRNQRVQELILERIERLPEEAIDVLQIAAVIGRDFSVDLLEEVALTDPVDGLELLLARKFLLERPDERLDFSHGVVRQVAYDTMSTLHRRRIHQRVGDAMITLQVADNAPSEVAFQYRNAGRNARLPYAHYSLLAGRKLLATYGFRQAINYFDDALFVLDTIPESDPQYDPKLIQQALIGRGLAAESLLDPEDMIETYRRQQRWAHKQNNRSFLLTAQGRLILMLALTGQQRQSNELLQELIRFVVDERQINVPASTQLTGESGEKSEKKSGEKSDNSPALEESPVLVDLITRRHHIYSPNLPDKSENYRSDTWVRYTPPAPAVDSAIEHLLQVLPPPQAILPLFDYGWILRIQGQLDESERCLKAVIELATETSQNFIASTAYHQLAVAMRMRGKMRKSQELNYQSIALNGQIRGAPAQLASLWPRIGSAFLDLRNNEVDRAERRLNRVANFLQNRNSFRSHWNSANIGLGEVALHRGQVNQARQLFADSLADSLNLYPYTYVRALLGQAQIAHIDGDLNDTETHLKQALYFAGTRSLIEEYTETVTQIVRLQPADASTKKLVKETKKYLKSAGLNEVLTLL